MTKLKYLTPIQHKYNTNSNTNSINLTKFGQNWPELSTQIQHKFNYVTNIPSIPICHSKNINYIPIILKKKNTKKCFFHIDIRPERYQCFKHITARTVSGAKLALS